MKTRRITIEIPLDLHRLLIERHTTYNKDAVEDGREQITLDQLIVAYLGWPVPVDGIEDLEPLNPESAYAE